MDFGTLRDKALIRKRGVSIDEAGQEVPDPTREATLEVYCRIEPLAGRELFYAKQVTPLVTHRITVRNVGGLNAADRITALGRNFDILSVRNLDERDRVMVLDCMERG
jgi:SPP1 family predicted phage head-tail adaptor